MGARNWLLAYFDESGRDILEGQPALDRSASLALAGRLFPGHVLDEGAEATLDWTAPARGEVLVGVYRGLSVIAAVELALDRPSTLPRRFIEASDRKLVFLQAMHSVVDWSAFALWEQGRLVRSLSLAPERGLVEDEGERLSFEVPYWSGEHPAIDPEDDDPEDSYPLPFHPLDLGEAAMSHFLGYGFEGYPDDWVVDPEEIPILAFKSARKGLFDKVRGLFG